MAATGEPYSVAARAIDAAAEPMADADAADAEPAAAEPIAAAADAAEPTSDSAGALTEVIACANRTLAASSARIEIQTDTDRVRDPVPALRRPLRLRPGLIGRLTRRAAGSALGRVAP
jgi:hypothetical protein